MPLCDEFVTYCQNFDFKIRRDHKKNSYERRDYESVDEKSLSFIMCKKATKKEFRQETVEENENLQFCLTLYAPV